MVNGAGRYQLSNLTLRYVLVASPLLIIYYNGVYSPEGLHSLIRKRNIH